MRLSSIPRVNSNHRKRRYSRRMAVGWMPGVKRKWRLVRGRVAFARGGGGESRRENEDEEGATYPSLLEESCLRFKNLVEVDARACVCTSFSFAVKADDWKIWKIERAFPLKGRFSFRFSPIFFWSMPGRDLENRLENITENEDGVIVGGRNEKERERRT